MTVEQMGENAPQQREQMGQKKKILPRHRNPLLADVKGKWIFKWRKTEVSDGACTQMTVRCRGRYRQTDHLIDRMRTWVLELEVKHQLQPVSVAAAK